MAILKNFFQKMKKNILVTGGLGILGNRLIELLSLDKNKVFF